MLPVQSVNHAPGLYLNLAQDNSPGMPNKKMDQSRAVLRTQGSKAHHLSNPYGTIQGVP